MKICVDENIPLLTVSALRIDHDVLDVRGTKQEGISDPLLWSLAQTEQRLLITTDKGFAHNRNEPHHGILIVRLRQPNQTKIHERVMRALFQVREGEWSGLLMVVRDEAQSVWRAKG